MTTRLYYTDATILTFDARIVAHDGDPSRVILDRTAFYPTSGGQPHDTGTLDGIAVLDVVEDAERIIHVLAAPLAAGDVTGVVDAARRQDHMEQHTSQHLLSALAADRFGWETASVHFGDDHSTIEFDVATAQDGQLAVLFERANAAVRSALPVTLSFEDAVAATARGLRKAATRDGELRVVTIAGLDRSACGGTHLANTAAIGAVVSHGVERVRDHLRLSFLAGGRVLRHLGRRDALVAALARELSCAEAELQELIPKRQRELQELRGRLSALEVEVAGHRVRAILGAVTPGLGGVRRAVHRGEGESPSLLRAMAQAVAAEPRAVVVIAAGPTIIVGSSADSGVDAGALLKGALAADGGRGGGSPRLAQGSAPDTATLDRVLERIIAP